MSDQAVKPAPPKGANDIQFFEHHLAPVPAGDYLLTATQTVTSKLPASLKGKAAEQKTITGKRGTTFTTTQSFTIAGERFKIKPQELGAVFPPAGSAGDHAYVLPHIILNRSTLPWERSGEKPQGDAVPDETLPWLALIHFRASEAPPEKVITYAELYRSATEGKVDYPELAPEPGNDPATHGDERVTVIDVPAKLAEKILPTLDELKLLTHTRQNKKDDGSDVGSEKAVCISNRLPERGGTSVVHLVSVERRYEKNGRFAQSGNLPVRLVSFKSWRFSCLDEMSYKVTSRTLSQLAQTLPQQISKAQREKLKELTEEIVDDQPFIAAATKAMGISATTLTDEAKQKLLGAARYKKLTFKSLLLELDRAPLTLPESQKTADNKAAKAAEQFRKRGYIPLLHHLRSGGQTVSWYHGPLQTGVVAEPAAALPVRSADKLLRYSPEFGMLDVSYAAAWELGRLLTLKNKRVSTELYRWKRTHAQQAEERKRSRSQLDYLPFTPISESVDFPAVVADWFASLARLEHIPFNYLIPDEQLLPTESIRFFNIDPFWVACLLDGAFSIGRLSKGDLLRDAEHHQNKGGLNLAVSTRSGFLMRSDVVAGWPDLQMEGHDQPLLSYDSKEREPLPLVRQAHLSANTLLTLFDGEMRCLEIHKKPETLHFGVSEPDDWHPEPYRRLRDAQGEETGNIENVPFREKTGKSVIEIQKLAGLLKTPNSAVFALEMIAGAERVRFNHTSL